MPKKYEVKLDMVEVGRLVDLMNDLLDTQTKSLEYKKMAIAFHYAMLYAFANAHGEYIPELDQLLRHIVITGMHNN